MVESHVPSASAILIPTVVTFLYGMIMLYLNYKDLFDGPYPFFRIKNRSTAAMASYPVQERRLQPGVQMKKARYWNVSASSVLSFCYMLLDSLVSG